MQRNAQRKYPPSGTSEQNEPTTMRNTGDAERKNSASQRDKSSAERGRPSMEPVINQSSEESFPASDPPSWSPTTAGSPCPGGDCDED